MLWVDNIKTVRNFEVYVWNWEAAMVEIMDWNITEEKHHYKEGLLLQSAGIVMRL